MRLTLQDGSDRADQQAVESPRQRRDRFLCSSVVSIALAGLGPLAAAQERDSTQLQRVDLQRVDEIWGDAGALSRSYRQLTTDLLRPSGFDHLYRVPGDPSYLARLDGGLAAVFPQSVYASTGSRAVPVVPPGTVFYVGGLPEDPGAWAARFTPEPTTPKSLISRELTALTPPSRRVADQRTQELQARSEPLPSIWHNDAHRRARIADLLGVPGLE